MLSAVMQALGGGAGVFRLPMAPDEDVLKGFPTMARRRELAPNAAGARALGFDRVGDDEARGGLEKVAGAGGTVIVLGDELTDQGADFCGSADLYVYLGSYPGQAAAKAHFVLPTTTAAEQEGTFTNLEGRVQRFWPGLQPPGMARPAWLILGALNAVLTEGDVPTDAAAAFAQLAGGDGAFSGLDYDTIGTRGALLREPAQLAGD
jgi:NADH dehydrogenase/NADH:ubiquinone oxidoreductase subunit G